MSLSLKLRRKYVSSKTRGVSTKANNPRQLMEVGAGIQVSPNMLRLFDRQSAFCEENVHVFMLTGIRMGRLGPNPRPRCSPRAHPCPKMGQRKAPRHNASE